MQRHITNKLTEKDKAKVALVHDIYYLTKQKCLLKDCCQHKFVLADYAEKENNMDVVR